ncbi:MAG: hypothetical protein CFH00_00899, partial [Alphaproteobacteria bacterium MarineAlpha1_Bin1]
MNAKMVLNRIYAWRDTLLLKQYLRFKRPATIGRVCVYVRPRMGIRTGLMW